jgi:hypothetical protein
VKELCVLDGLVVDVEGDVEADLDREVGQDGLLVKALLSGPRVL